MTESVKEYPRVVEYMNKVHCFNDHNNIELTYLKDGYAEGKVLISRNSLNPYGNVHGGLLYAAADYVGGFAATGDSRNAVTQSGNINFLLPTSGEYLDIKATVVKSGKKVAVVEICIYDDQGRLTATCTNTYFYVNSIC